MDPNAFGKFALTGKTALVTGGGTGIGYFMSRALARGGARVLISARREDVLKAAVTRLKAESKSGQVQQRTGAATPGRSHGSAQYRYAHFAIDGGLSIMMRPNYLPN